MMNLPLSEVEGALKDLNVVMLATEPDFWDNRYYPMSTLNEYLCQRPEDQTIETETMRLYLLDRRLIPNPVQPIEGGNV